MNDRLFWIFLATILVVRIVVLLKPIPSPTIKGFRTHHYMWGLLGILVAFLIRFPVLYAIGLGLFVDELVYLLIGGKTHQDNYSKVSLFGTFLLLVLVYLFRSIVFSIL